MTHKQNREWRSFGLTVGAIFLLIGLWPAVFRSESIRLWSVVAGGGLILPALMYPSSLRLPYRAWMALGHVLGWVNTRILLSIAFIAVITPTGLIRRLFGKESLTLTLDKSANSYRVSRQPRAASHMKHQY